MSCARHICRYTLNLSGIYVALPLKGLRAIWVGVLKSFLSEKCETEEVSPIEQRKAEPIDLRLEC